MNETPEAEDNLKTRVARTVKWNVIDRVSSQVLYAVTGIVLARMLSQEEFGLVTAILVFQAFASLFVDSGFSSALIQRKDPTRLDYSTVLWFNIAMSVGLYVILFFLAPVISCLFGGDPRLIPLARVMFLSFIINAASIVQANRLMKRMDVRMIAVSNSAGLFAGSVVGIWLAVEGYGAWAMVWQTIAIATIKTVLLWFTGGWTPLRAFSWKILRGFFAVGSGVMASSFLNTVFQNVAGFVIGLRAGLTPLGYYGQADKWSKMGVMSLSQVLTSSFLPLLSRVQDDSERYARMCGKTHRFAAYAIFPSLGLLWIVAPQVFHVLFGEKWDLSIPLFRILLVQGIFTALTLLTRNFILGLGHARTLVITEAVRDGAAIIAIAATLPWVGDTTPSDPLGGLTLLLWGQLAASVLAWGQTLYSASGLTRRGVMTYLADILPYAVLTLLGVVPCLLLATTLKWPPLALGLLQGAVFAAIYAGGCHISGSRIQADVWAYARGRLR